MAEERKDSSTNDLAAANTDARMDLDAEPAMSEAFPDVKLDTASGNASTGSADAGPKTVSQSDEDPSPPVPSLRAASPMQADADVEMVEETIVPAESATSATFARPAAAGHDAVTPYPVRSVDVQEVPARTTSPIPEPEVTALSNEPAAVLPDVTSPATEVATDAAPATLGEPFVLKPATSSKPAPRPSLATPPGHMRVVIPSFFRRLNQPFSPFS